MKRYILKGLHHSVPRNLPIPKSKKTLTWDVQLLGDMAYEFPDWQTAGDGSDQWDWSKLLGVSWNWLNPDKAAAMIGWCYDPETKLIHLTPYFNRDGKRIYGEEVYKFPLWSKIRIKLNLDESSKTCYFTFQNIEAGSDPKLTISKTYFIPYKKNYYLINFYFGGNRTAPKCVAVNIENK